MRKESILKKMHKMMITILWILWTFVLSLVAILSFLISPFGHVSLSIFPFWAKSLLRIAKIRLVVQCENFPLRNLSYLYVSNHESALDIIALYASLPQKVVMVAKQSLRLVPFIGWLMRLTGFIFINRANRDSAYHHLEKAIAKLKKGQSVVIFPEGTFGRSKELLPFKRGAFFLSQESGVPIVPIGIYGTRHVWPPDHILLEPSTISICIGSPVFPPPAGTSFDRFRQQVRSEIEQLREKARILVEG